MNISVVIPTRHRNDLLGRCLDCLAPGVQTLPADQYEVIVSDDGSESTAQKMIKERYPWARWISGPRGGPAMNRNNGARQARGEFVAFTDDDCLPEPQWLDAFAQAIREDVHVYEGKTTCKAGLRSPLEHAPINLTGGWLWSCNMMVRREWFLARSGFDEDFPHAAMEDIAFHTRISQEGQRPLFVIDAAVDHPPRRMQFKARIRVHESHVIFWSKFPEHRPSLCRHLLRRLSGETRKIRQTPLSFDSLVAAAQLVAECAVVTVRYPFWVKKYFGRASPLKGSIRECA